MNKFVLLCFVAILSACLAQPTPTSTPTASGPFVIKAEDNPYAPKPKDLSMKQAGVILTSVDLSELADSTPLRSQLTILGSMPSVCNELRVNINLPNQAYEIRVEIYSIINPNVTCDDVFQQFQTSILLGEYSAGQYSIWVNDNFIGNIVAY